jgi:hypothetical protein
MFRIGLPVRSLHRMEPKWQVPRFNGPGVDTVLGKPVDGRRHGVRNRFLNACGSTFRMTSLCASVMKRSTRRCTFRAVGLYGGN